MNTNLLFFWGIYFVIVSLCSLLVGKIMHHFFKDDCVGFEDRLLNLIRIDSITPMNCKKYIFSLLTFNLFGFIVLLLILLLQGILPLNPTFREGLPFLTALNIATSFVTNTNWQNYGGENTLSYFSQMAGLTVQNFLSAATGFAVMMAFLRGVIKNQVTAIGNFWSDMTRFLVRILLPLSLLMAIILMHQGVPQTFDKSASIKTLENKEMEIPLGPVASQVAIKMLGSNGGGYFNANGAHPFENPTPLSNFIQLISIVLLPMACVFMFIFMLPNKKDGLVILIVMMSMLFIALTISQFGQSTINPYTHLPFFEGVDQRFSIEECTLWSVLTTSVSNGSVNCMHSSLSPFAQLMALFNMMTGEIILGGVGAGLYGMFLYVLITVFLSGLMVGRTPEYMGKKIESKEIIWASFALLSPGLFNLIFSSLSLNISPGLASLSHNGTHGLSEVLYAFSSTFGNNGSAFAGLNANAHFYNLTTTFAMLFGRFGVIIPVLIIAGSLACKKKAPQGLGTLRTDNTLFGILLLSVIIVIGALTFFPVLILGPIAEYMIMGLS